MAFINFEELRHQNIGIDVRIFTNNPDQFVDAHRLVLSAVSLFFRDYFIPYEEATFLVLRVPGISFQALDDIVNFCYSGRWPGDWPWARMAAFERLGRSFRVLGLDDGQQADDDNVDDQGFVDGGELSVEEWTPEEV